MNERRRNMMVGIFVAAGVVMVGWLIMRFGELPGLLYRMDAYEIEIYFPDASGVRENTQLQFRGYPVGRILGVERPRLISMPGEEGKEFLVVARATIDQQHEIPRNVVAEVFQRGFGSAFIQLNLKEAPSEEILGEGDVIRGQAGGVGGVLPEGTQKMIERLAESLSGLAEDLRGQFEPVTPAEVDAEPNRVQANLSTVVMRLDAVLKNVNEVVGDEEAQENVRRLLREAVAMVERAQATLERIDELAAKATELAGRTGAAVDEVKAELTRTAAQVQEGMDAFAAAMVELRRVLAETRQGEGTAGRLIGDPQLYEELVDTLEILQATMMEFQKQIQLWRERGILYKE